MSASNINKLLDIFTAYLQKHDDHPPFSSCKELYNVIDNVQVGNISWECFGVKYSGNRPDPPVPWMDDIYNVWMCDSDSAISQIIGNADFDNLLDFVPFREYDTETNTWCWQNFMLGDWAWEEAVQLFIHSMQSGNWRLGLHRISLPVTLLLMGHYSCQLSLVQTRQQCLWRWANMTTTHISKSFILEQQPQPHIILQHDYSNLQSHIVTSTWHDGNTTLYIASQVDHSHSYIVIQPHQHSQHIAGRVPNPQ